MATGPERRFINAVHRQVSRKIKKQGMSISLPGTPDYYYDNDTLAPIHTDQREDDLWLEYKWWDGYSDIKILTPEFRPRQREWLERRYHNGQNAFCVVGFHLKGKEIMGVVLQPSQFDGVSPLHVARTMKTPKEIAHWIHVRCGYYSAPE